MVEAFQVSLDSSPGQDPDRPPPELCPRIATGRGEYVYVCTFPGHYNGSMKGVLVVK
jgi:hypothetical protein